MKRIKSAIWTGSKTYYYYFFFLRFSRLYISFKTKNSTFSIEHLLYVKSGMVEQFSKFGGGGGGGMGD